MPVRPCAAQRGKQAVLRQIPAVRCNGADFALQIGQTARIFAAHGGDKVFK